MVKVGTRKSKLAKAQTQILVDQWKAIGIPIEIIEMSSPADQDLTKPLYEMAMEPGLFTKDLQKALHEKRIDIAIHSLKDLPTQEPPGLKLGAVSKRATSNDCLILHPDAYDPSQKWGIGEGETVGTSSLRRQAQWWSQRKDLKFFPIRGNLTTRLEKVSQKKVSGIVLACAGLERLGVDLGVLKKIELPEESFIPAPAQGALGVEIREEDFNKYSQLLTHVNHLKTFEETQVEREILRKLEGGCTLPLGVRCHKENDASPYLVSTFLGIRDQVNRWVDAQSFEVREKDRNKAIEKTVSFFEKHITRV